MGGFQNLQCFGKNVPNRTSSHLEAHIFTVYLSALYFFDARVSEGVSHP